MRGAVVLVKGNASMVKLSEFPKEKGFYWCTLDWDDGEGPVQQVCLIEHRKNEPFVWIPGVEGNQRMVVKAIGDYVQPPTGKKVRNW